MQSLRGGLRCVEKHVWSQQRPVRNEKVKASPLDHS